MYEMRLGEPEVPHLRAKVRTQCNHMSHDVLDNNAAPDNAMHVRIYTSTRRRARSSSSSSSSWPEPVSALQSDCPRMLSWFSGTEPGAPQAHALPNVSSLLRVVRSHFDFGQWHRRRQFWPATPCTDGLLRIHSPIWPTFEPSIKWRASSWQMWEMTHGLTVDFCARPFGPRPSVKSKPQHALRTSTSYS